MANGVVEKIANDIVESTRTIHEINKENLANIKADTKATFDKATAPDPGLEKVKQTKDVKNKAKAIVDNIVEGAKENTQKEKERLAEIKSHNSYRKILEEQRSSRKATVKPWLL
jgi:hypothetical protein